MSVSKEPWAEDSSGSKPIWEGEGQPCAFQSFSKLCVSQEGPFPGLCDCEA